MTEMNRVFGGQGEPQYAEHSHSAKSKKVIPGPMHLPSDPLNDLKSIDPINLAVSAVSASMTLLRNKAYRIISTVAVNFRLSVGANTAVTTDVYLPANTPIVITTEKWDTLSAIAGGAGNLQAVEVE